jgi:hypothetical protein
VKHSLFIAALALGSCSTPSGDAEWSQLPGGVELSVKRFVGTGLTGPLPRELSLAEDTDLVSLSFELVHLEHLPDFGLRSLALQSGFIADPSQRSPLKPASVLATVAAFGRNEEIAEVRAALERGVAGRTHTLLSEQRILPVGASAVLDLSRVWLYSERMFEWRPDPRVETIDQTIALCLSREAADQPLTIQAEIRGPLPRLELELEGESPLSPVQTLNERTAGRSRWLDLQLNEELVIPHQLLEVDTPGVVIVCLSPFEGETQHGFAIFARASSDPSLRTAGDLEQLQSELAAESAAANRLVSETETSLARNRTLLRALEHLEPDSEGRRTLGVLANLVGARLCTDLALVADDEVLALLVDQLRKTTSTLLDSNGKDELAWKLESTSYALLAALDPEDELSDELTGVLLHRAGEVGRYSTSLEEAVLVSTDLASLEEALVSENLVFLEDPDPSSRVRAFDWLLSHDRAPRGFDPLASAQDRRAALLSFEQEQAAESVSPGEQP